MASEEDLANAALRRIGITRKIVHLFPVDGGEVGIPQDETPEAQIVRDCWFVALLDVNDKRRWRFAEARTFLALAPPPDPINNPLVLYVAAGYDYVYSLPSDCLVPREVWPGTATPTAEEVVPWRREGRYLLTNLVDAELLYTAVVISPDTGRPDVTVYPPTYLSAVIHRLAAELALAIPGKDQKWAAMMAAFKADLSEAGCIDANQAAGEPPQFPG